MSTSLPHTARFNRTLERITKESFWLNTENAALQALEGVDHYGVDFFRIAWLGIRGDRLIRLVRLLEDGPRVASFWYLHRCEPRVIETTANIVGVDLKRLHEFSARLRSIRNQVFVHIDKKGVFDPEGVYKKAGITEKQVHAVVQEIWRLMLKLHTDFLCKPFMHDEYNGEDVSALVAMRDKARGVDNI
jgi:hypothetical protein